MKLGYYIVVEALNTIQIKMKRSTSTIVRFCVHGCICVCTTFLYFMYYCWVTHVAYQVSMSWEYLHITTFLQYTKCFCQLLMPNTCRVRTSADVILKYCHYFTQRRQYAYIVKSYYMGKIRKTNSTHLLSGEFSQ